MAAKKPEKVKGLTPKRQIFVERYCVHGNGTKAAIEAGYSAKTAEVQAYQLLQLPSVKEAIAKKTAIVAEKSGIEAVEVLKRMFDIATANPNDLIAHRIGACRYCHGSNGAFQWIDTNEFAEAVLSARKSGQQPTHEGGYGFDPRRDPSGACLKCFGIGVPRIEVADTAKLTGKAALLYAGVKATKYGVEVLMHDQMKALEMVARHLGLFADKETGKGDGQSPIYLMIQSIQGSILRPAGQKSVLTHDQRPAGQKSVLTHDQRPVLDLSAASGSSIGPAAVTRREGV